MDAASKARDDVVLDYVSKEGRKVTHVRSTLLAASLQTLRDVGAYDRYERLLSPRFRDTILLTLAPTWHPMEVALAHYEAWEALEFTTTDLQTISETVSNRIMGTFVATLVRSSRSVGTSPMFALGHYDRLWQRLFTGGAVRIVQRGPKDAWVESSGLPLFGGRCFSISYLGVARTALLLFAKTVAARALPPPAPDVHRATYSWV